MALQQKTAQATQLDVSAVCGYETNSIEKRSAAALLVEIAKKWDTEHHETEQDEAFGAANDSIYPTKKAKMNCAGLKSRKSVQSTSRTASIGVVIYNRY